MTEIISTFLAALIVGAILLPIRKLLVKRKQQRDLQQQNEPDTVSEDLSEDEIKRLHEENLAYFRSTYRDDEPPKYQKEDTSPDAASSEAINNIDALLESIQKE